MKGVPQQPDIFTLLSYGAEQVALGRKTGPQGFRARVNREEVPALKRMIIVEILSRSTEALLPPHACKRGLPPRIRRFSSFHTP